MKTKTELKIGLFIIILFGMFGAFILAIIIHENIHKVNYIDVIKSKERICYLSPYELGGGYYAFTIPESEERKIKKIEKYDESSAYSLSILPFLLFILGFVLILKNIISDFYEVKR